MTPEERKVYLREWRQRNKAHTLAYRKANRARRNENWRNRQEAWKDRRAETKAAWHERNRDRVLAAKKAARKANPGWNRAHYSKRRATLKGATVEKVDFTAVLARANGLCGICGRELSGVIHYDHIVPLAAGGLHAEGNLQAAHARCNLKKGTRVSVI